MKKFFKYIFLIIVGTLIFLGIFVYLVVFTDVFSSKEEITFNNRLEEKIAAGEQKIPLQDLTDFEWDKVYYFPVEYSREDLENEVGFSYDGEIPSTDCDPQQKSDLVFVKGRKITIVPNSYCDIKSNCEKTTTDMTYVTKCAKNTFITLKKIKSVGGKFYNLLILNEGEKI